MDRPHSSASYNSPVPSSAHSSTFSIDSASSSRSKQLHVLSSDIGVKTRVYLQSSRPSSSLSQYDIPQRPQLLSRATIPHPESLLAHKPLTATRSFSTNDVAAYKDLPNIPVESPQILIAPAPAVQKPLLDLDLSSFNAGFGDFLNTFTISPSKRSPTLPPIDVPDLSQSWIHTTPPLSHSRGESSQEGSCTTPKSHELADQSQASETPKVSKQIAAMRKEDAILPQMKDTSPLRIVRKSAANPIVPPIPASITERKRRPSVDELLSAASAKLAELYDPSPSASSTDSSVYSDTSSATSELPTSWNSDDPYQQSRLTFESANTSIASSEECTATIMDDLQLSSRYIDTNNTAEANAKWEAITTALKKFNNMQAVHDNSRAAHMSDTLLPFLADHVQIRSTRSHLNPAHLQSITLIQWGQSVLNDLRGDTCNRGVCLDSLAAVLESPLLHPNFYLLEKSLQDHYQLLLARTIQFALERLNDKACFANTLNFAAKLLALAFFRVPDFANNLLGLLPGIKGKHIIRVLAETPPSNGTSVAHLFPLFLRHLCTTNKSTLMSLFLSSSAKLSAPTTISVAGIKLEMAGNWTIRFTSTDSDLPFAFYRAYHRILAMYIPSAQLEPASIIQSPGYVLILASLLEKADALLNRSLATVTTLSPHVDNIQANEATGDAAGQKPRMLETLTKRISVTHHNSSHDTAKSSLGLLFRHSRELLSRGRRCMMPEQSFCC